MFCFWAYPPKFCPYFLSPQTPEFNCGVNSNPEYQIREIGYFMYLSILLLSCIMKPKGDSVKS